jgi:hypothetical protein
VVLLGMDAAGDLRGTAETITAVIGFAASVGVDIQAGTFPTGMTMRANKVSNATCAELINECLAYHADWLTWIDYSTSPPTFNIATRATATTRSFAVDGTGEVAAFDIVRRDDLRPVRCIIKVETAGGITGVAGFQRGLVVDMYPAAPETPPDPLPLQGPGVLIATVPSPSAGGGGPGTPSTINTTKARIKTRLIPDNATDAKAWLKKKYPHLAPLDDTDFSVTGWTPSLVTPDIADPDPVDEDNPQTAPTSWTDIPRELIDGQITDWMDAMSGRVKIVATISPTGTASDADKLLIARPLPPVVMVCTDKATGTYSHVTSVTYGEAATGSPIVQAGYYEGLAEDYYNALNQWAYEGGLTIAAEEIPSDRHIGCAVNLTGGQTAWATMNALVNRVSWDIQTARVRIDFGPPRWLSFADFIAMMDALRRPPGSPGAPDARTETTFGFEEDEGEDLRDQGYRTPASEFEVPDFTAGEGVIPFKLSARNDAGTLKWSVSSAYASITDGTNGDTIDLSSAGFDTETGHTISATKYIVLEGSVDSSLAITAWTLTAVDLANADEVGLAGSPSAQNKIRLLIGKVVVDTAPDPDTVAVTQAVFTPQRVTLAFLNGLEVKVFEAAPIHPDDL